MIKYPDHIQKKLEVNKDYYSLYSMSNIERCKVDNDYLDEVIIVNSDLIWFSIHKYVGDPVILAATNSIDKDDIFQLGVLGFLKAIKAFDTQRGVKFSSFAVTTIVREVRCFIRDSANLIRLTRKAHSLVREIRKVEQDLGYTPTVEELSIILDEKEEKICKALQIGKPVKYLEEHDYSNSDYNMTSLDLLRDDTDIYSQTVDKVYIESIIKAIRNNLTPLELDILKSQLKGHSQTNTAKICNVSQMRVSRAIKKIARLIQENTDIISENI